MSFIALVLMTFQAPTVEAQTLTISTTTSIISEIDQRMDLAGITDQDDRQRLQAIAYCESQDRQFNSDGTLLRGIVDNDDTGVFQINRHFHPYKTAVNNGFDYDTTDGNIDFALDLYKSAGTEPWNASRSCWTQSLLAVK